MHSHGRHPQRVLYHCAVCNASSVATLTDPTMVHLLQVMGQDMGRARGPR